MSIDAKTHRTESAHMKSAQESASPGAGAGGDMEHFDKVFSLVAFAVNRHIVDHLLRFARQFGPDYQMLVIWAVLAHQCVLHLVPLGVRADAILNDRGRLADPDPDLHPVRQRDLSQITGIPKETVRRKLLKLEQNGWIARKGNGWVMVATSIDPELREFSRESARRLLVVADQIRAMLRQGGTRP